MYLKVLILDKSKENIKTISAIVRQAGFIPLFSQSEHQAQEIVKQQGKELLAVFFQESYSPFIQNDIKPLLKNVSHIKYYKLKTSKPDTTFEQEQEPVNHHFTEVSINITPDELHQKLTCPTDGIPQHNQIAEVESDKGVLAKRSVLLVEDDDISVFVAKHILEEANIVVSVANNGQEAVDMLFAAPTAFDLILMDIQMPVLDGHQASQAIRQLDTVDNTLPIIAMTAHSIDCEKDRCKNSGMNDHIAKPINAQKVYSSLAKWLRDKP